MRTISGKGWGQLPREIAMALAGAKINGSESRMLWAMVYKTIAFNKSNDGIPWSQLEELTGIDQWHIGRAINSLLKKGIIFKKDNVFGIQTDFSKWEVPPKRVAMRERPPNQGELPPNQGDLPPNQVDSRDLSKRTIQEKGFSTSLEKDQIERNKKGITRSKEIFKQLMRDQEAKDKAFIKKKQSDLSNISGKKSK